jgi:hypothetical protein
MDHDLNEFPVDLEIVDEALDVLHRLSLNYDENSPERKAIELAAFAMRFCHAERVRASFRSFINNMHRPLSEKERNHLKSMNIDPDTGDSLQDDD